MTFFLLYTIVIVPASAYVGWLIRDVFEIRLQSNAKPDPIKTTKLERERRRTRTVTRDGITYAEENYDLQRQNIV